MGFTRYWKQPKGIARESWSRIVADARTLIGAIDIPLVGDEDDGDPAVTDERICFNGGDDESAEPFVLRPAAAKSESVKTNGYPYDTVAAAVLAIAKHHAPLEVVGVTSDDAGGDDDWDDCWQPAIDLCAQAGVAIAPASIAALQVDVLGKKGAQARAARAARVAAVPPLSTLAPPPPTDPSVNSARPIEERRIPGQRPWRALFAPVHVGDRATASAFVRDFVENVMQRKLGQPPDFGIFVALTGVLSAAEFAAEWTAAVADNVAHIVFMSYKAVVCAFPEGGGEPQEPVPLLDPELRNRVLKQVEKALKKQAEELE